MVVVFPLVILLLGVIFLGVLVLISRENNNNKRLRREKRHKFEFIPNEGFIKGAQGPEGKKGFNGSQGREGKKGFSGVRGIQGSNGTRGFQGFNGNNGLQGTSIVGVQGAVGISGIYKGVQGIEGIKGLQGAVGLAGSSGGEIGYQGVQGLQGVQGMQGAQGYQGVQGLQGAQGRQGFQGRQGAQGFQGVQGLQGIQGAQGFQGPQGPKGDDGFAGVTNNNGTDFSIAGTTLVGSMTQDLNSTASPTFANLNIAPVVGIVNADNIISSGGDMRIRVGTNGSTMYINNDIETTVCEVGTGGTNTRFIVNATVNSVVNTPVFDVSNSLVKTQHNTLDDSNGSSRFERLYYGKVATSLPNVITPINLTAEQVLGGLIIITNPNSTSASTTLIMPTGDSIIAAIPFAKVTMSFELRVVNLTLGPIVIDDNKGTTVADNPFNTPLGPWQGTDIIVNVTGGATISIYLNMPTPYQSTLLSVVFAGPWVVNPTFILRLIRIGNIVTVQPVSNIFSVSAFFAPPRTVDTLTPLPPRFRPTGNDSLRQFIYVQNGATRTASHAAINPSTGLITFYRTNAEEVFDNTALIFIFTFHWYSDLATWLN